MLPCCPSNCFQTLTTQPNFLTLLVNYLSERSYCIRSISLGTNYAPFNNWDMSPK